MSEHETNIHFSSHRLRTPTPTMSTTPSKKDMETAVGSIFEELEKAKNKINILTKEKNALVSERDSLLNGSTDEHFKEQERQLMSEKNSAIEKVIEKLNAVGKFLENFTDFFGDDSDLYRMVSDLEDRFDDDFKEYKASNDKKIDSLSKSVDKLTESVESLVSFFSHNKSGTNEDNEDNEDEDNEDEDNEDNEDKNEENKPILTVKKLKKIGKGFIVEYTINNAKGKAVKTEALTHFYNKFPDYNFSKKQLNIIRKKYEASKIEGPSKKMMKRILDSSDI